MKSLTLVLAILLLSAGESRAALYLEPFLGYAKGKVTFVNTTTVTKSMKGTGYGARFGVSNLMFAAGGEYHSASLKFEEGSAWEPSDIGVFAGVFAPLGFRAWATYFFSAKMGELSGSAWKFGVGYRFMPYVAINLEYLKHNYKAFALEDTTSIKDDSTTYFLSVSVPLSF